MGVAHNNQRKDTMQHFKLNRFGLPIFPMPRPIKTSAEEQREQRLQATHERMEREVAKQLRPRVGDPRGNRQRIAPINITTEGVK